MLSRSRLFPVSLCVCACVCVRLGKLFKLWIRKLMENDEWIKEKQSKKRAAIKRNVTNSNHHRKRGGKTLSQLCVCVRTYVCACLCWSGNSLAFSALFTLLWPESEKQDHTRAGAKLENGEEKKSSRTAKKNSAARKIPVSQRIAKRVTESYKRHFWKLVLAAKFSMGGFFGPGQLRKWAVTVIGEFWPTR